MSRPRFLVAASALFGLVLTPRGEAIAQGMFLDRGTSGLGVSAGLCSHNDYYGADLSLGYSVNGIVDLGVSWGKSRFDATPGYYYYDYRFPGLCEGEMRGLYAAQACDAAASAFPIVYPSYLPQKITGSTVSPSVTVHLVRQSHWVPVSLAAIAAYEATSYSGDWWEVVQYKSRGFSFGASVYRSHSFTARFSATAELGFVRRAGTLERPALYAIGYPLDQGSAIRTMGPETTEDLNPAFVPGPSTYRFVDQRTYREYFLGVHLNYAFPSGVAVHVSPGFSGNANVRRFSFALGFTAPRSFVF